MLTRAQSAAEGQIHVLEIAGNAIVGGMEKYVYNMATQLPAGHFKVSCLTPFESTFTTSLRQAGSQVYITDMDINPSWRSIQFVTELVRRLKVDLIHTHLPKAHLLGAIVGKMTRVPVVATVHGMDINNEDLGICKTAGTHLTVVCNAAYAQALALGIDADHLTLIPNGVDTTLFHPGQSGATFRKALHIPVGAPLVGFVGRLAWEKGPDQFLRAAQYAHKIVPGAHFVMVGDGPEEADLRARIQEAHLEENFHLAGTWPNTWNVYPALDVVALTSRVEGMPFALLEAMASGRAVVAVGIGGVLEIVEAGSTGLLSANGDWKGTGEAIAGLLENPERMKQMGQNARKRVEQVFNLQDSVRLMGYLFYRMLEKKPPQDLLPREPGIWSLQNLPDEEDTSVASGDGASKVK